MPEKIMIDSVLDAIRMTIQVWKPTVEEGLDWKGKAEICREKFGILVGDCPNRDR